MSSFSSTLSAYATAIFPAFEKENNLSVKRNNEGNITDNLHNKTKEEYEKAKSIVEANRNNNSVDNSNADPFLTTLSSSGPLDDGSSDDSPSIDSRSRHDNAWNNLSQHVRTKTTPSTQLSTQEPDHVHQKANLRVNFSSPNTKRTQFNQFNYRDLEDASEHELSACATIERSDVGIAESMNEIYEGQYSSEDNKDPLSFSSRRTVRSHTSQGIPIQKANEELKMFLNVQNQADVENLFASLNDDDANSKSMKRELEYYKALSLHLLDRNNDLVKKLSENALSGNVANNVPTPPSSANAFQAPWLSNGQVWQTMPELSPDIGTKSTPKSFSVSPDPFSPYEQPSPIPQHLLTPQSIKNKCSSQEKNDASQIGHDSDSSLQCYEATSGAPNSYMQGLKMDFTGSQKLPWSPEGCMGYFVGLPLAAHHPKNPFFSSSMFPPAFHSTYFDHPRGNFIPSQVDRIKKKTIDNNTPLELLVKLALTPDGQEASIKLQQKLKSQEPIQREAAMNAITPHLHQLAYCRHGNFLVQRAINLNGSLGWTFANTFVKLSLSQYGCHVVQKLLDFGDEDVREMIANELLNERLEETIASRHAIHIWQKVLDTQWQNASMRPKIINTLNKTLRGKWADVAMSETGSLICQNLFESGCATETEECMVEIVDRICECATGQWGVWVVQYIIEHASGEIKKAALNQMLSEATKLSVSQHGQKAIMSAIRSKSPSFLAAYIDVLCEYEVACPYQLEESTTTSHIPSNRRSILVDIATSTHGDQIITQLLTSSTTEQRERIIKTVRKNSVFLKGSKAGLKIYQLCERARAFTGY